MVFFGFIPSGVGIGIEIVGAVGDGFTIIRGRLDHIGDVRKNRNVTVAVFASVGNVGVPDAWGGVAAHPEGDVVGEWRIFNDSFPAVFIVFNALGDDGLVGRVVGGEA